MNLKYKIELSNEERQRLEKMTSSGTTSARKLIRAQILLKSDQSQQGTHWKYEQICAAYNVTPVTVMKVRKSFVESGLEATLERKKPDREYVRALDGEAEAHLIALACSEPPTGQTRWSLRLLRDRFIRLGHVDHVSHETIRIVLKKTNLNLGSKNNGASRPKQMQPLSATWKTFWKSTNVPMTPNDH
jgi:hypothetical protein